MLPFSTFYRPALKTLQKERDRVHALATDNQQLTAKDMLILLEFDLVDWASTLEAVAHPQSNENSTDELAYDLGDFGILADDILSFVDETLKKYPQNKELAIAWVQIRLLLADPTREKFTTNIRSLKQKLALCGREVIQYIDNYQAFARTTTSISYDIELSLVSLNTIRSLNIHTKTPLFLSALVEIMVLSSKNFQPSQPEYDYSTRIAALQSTILNYIQQMQYLKNGSLAGDFDSHLLYNWYRFYALVLNRLCERFEGNDANFSALKALLSAFHRYIEFPRLSELAFSKRQSDMAPAKTFQLKDKVETNDVDTQLTEARDKKAVVVEVDPSAPAEKTSTLYDAVQNCFGNNLEKVQSMYRADKSTLLKGIEATGKTVLTLSGLYPNSAQDYFAPIVSKVLYPYIYHKTDPLDYETLSLPQQLALAADYLSYRNSYRHGKSEADLEAIGTITAFIKRHLDKLLPNHQKLYDRVVWILAEHSQSVQDRISYYQELVAFYSEKQAYLKLALTHQKLLELKKVHNQDDYLKHAFEALKAYNQCHHCQGTELMSAISAIILISRQYVEKVDGLLNRFCWQVVINIYLNKDLTKADRYALLHELRGSPTVFGHLSQEKSGFFYAQFPQKMDGIFAKYADMQLYSFEKMLELEQDLTEMRVLQRYALDRLSDLAHIEEREHPTIKNYKSLFDRTTSFITQAQTILSTWHTFVGGHDSTLFRKTELSYLNAQTNQHHKVGLSSRK